ESPSGTPSLQADGAPSEGTAPDRADRVGTYPARRPLPERIEVPRADPLLRRRAGRAPGGPARDRAGGNPARPCHRLAPRLAPPARELRRPPAASGGRQRPVRTVPRGGPGRRDPLDDLP